MYCNRCGKRVEGNDRLCVPCKAALFDRARRQKGGEAADAAPLSSPISATVSDLQKATMLSDAPRCRWGLVPAIVAVVLALVGVVCAAYGVEFAWRGAAFAWQTLMEALWGVSFAAASSGLCLGALLRWLRARRLGKRLSAVTPILLGISALLIGSVLVLECIVLCLT